MLNEQVEKWPQKQVSLVQFLNFILQMKFKKSVSYFQRFEPLETNIIKTNSNSNWYNKIVIEIHNIGIGILERKRKANQRFELCFTNATDPVHKWPVENGISLLWLQFDSNSNSENDHPRDEW